MKNLALMFGLVFTFAAAPRLAQQPDGAKIRASLAQNQETLREYMWQSRVMVAVDGEEQKVDLFQVRYNLAGDLERTRLGGEAQEMKRPRGPLRKRVARNKKEGAAEFAESVKDHLQRYMSPVGFSRALKNAFMRMSDDTITLRSDDVVVKGDTVEFELLGATKQPVSMRIESVVDDEPVKMTVMFQKLPGGPNYPARQVVDTQLGDKNLVITTENFDYVKPRG